MKSANPIWEAVVVAIVAFSAGLLTAAGFQHLRSQFEQYAWISDFLFALAMCLFAVVQILGLRQAPSTSASSDKQVSAEPGHTPSSI